MVFSLTGGVSFCSGVGRARGSYGEPKVTPPSLVYTPSDLTSEVTDHFPGRQRRRRRSRRWQRRSRRKRVILFIGSVLVFALAILAVLAFEWLLDLAVK